MTRKSDRIGSKWLAFFLTACVLAAGPAFAQHGDEARMLPPPDAAGSPFLLKGTSVRTVVSGPVAHVVVTQRWENPNTSPVDGLYIFPLPENAAVTDMTLRIGERTIRSDMKRREEARQIYEQARREGRVAGLLDQERPNVFAQQVANLMPGMAIDVTLSFDHEVKCEDGECEYVFPTVVGPRFIPADQTNPGRIDPPVIEEGRNTGQTLSMQVALDAGVRIRSIQSPSHPITLSRDGDARAEVALAEGARALLNKDFRLRWTLGGDQPELGFLAWRDPESKQDPGVFTLILQPQADPDDDDVTPRELFFVLDCSGSMSGGPIEAAKNVVRKALRAVRPQDTFQIIRFSENASGLGPQPLSPTPDNIRLALAYLDGLGGQGGTNMMQGIHAALDRPDDSSHLRIVAFLTDGYIGNESQVLGEVRKSLGNSRIFSFGIGSSVNRYLLESLAEEGRGASAFLGARETPDQMVDRFIKRIDAPVLTDIRLTWEDVDVEDIEPAKIPDLFAGQSLLVHGRYRTPGTGLVIVEGKRRGRPVTLRKVAHFLDREEDNEALGRLWARARIHRLEREMHDGMREDVKGAIIDLGLRHRLMTAWTSLVAVDSLVSNTTGSSQSVEVPVEMPEDVSREGVFGRRGAGQQVTAMGYPQPAIVKAPVSSLPVRQFAPPQPRPEESRGRGPSYRMDGDVKKGEEAQRAGDENEAKALSFKRLTIVDADGSKLVVQGDGEVWLFKGRGRTLVHAMSAAEMVELRRLLAASGLTASSGAAVPGARIEAVGDWGTSILALPSADAAVQSLVSLIQSFA